MLNRPFRSPHDEHQAADGACLMVLEQHRQSWGKGGCSSARETRRWFLPTPCPLPQRLPLLPTLPPLQRHLQHHR